MEAAAAAHSGGGGKGGAAGEVRRIHIIYFLSHMGRIQHPHLIRLHHLHRNGVYLRDIKRWLADLRGKDMPEAFAWSYKRKYKNGYVWQDLVDDDLITPISDNEYVLKGSEIFPTTTLFGKTTNQISYYQDQDQHKQEEQSEEQARCTGGTTTAPDTPPPKLTASPETIYQLQESPIFSSSERSLTLTDDSISIKQEEEEEEDASKSQSCHEQQQEQPSTLHGKLENTDQAALPISPCFYSSRMNKQQGNYTEHDKVMEITPSPSPSPTPTPTPISLLSSSSSQLPFSSRTNKSSSKSYSSRTSKMLRSFITCGAVDTNDAVLVALNKSNCSSNGRSAKTEGKADDHQIFTVNKGPDQILGDQTCSTTTTAISVFGTRWNHQHYSTARKSLDGSTTHSKKQRQQTTFGSSRTVSTAHKPVGAPICSQCGKSFKPDKLHAHMKSCRGMRGSVTATASAPFHHNRRGVVTM